MYKASKFINKAVRLQERMQLQIRVNGYRNAGCRQIERTRDREKQLAELLELLVRARRGAAHKYESLDGKNARNYGSERGARVSRERSDGSARATPSTSYS